MTKPPVGLFIIAKNEGSNLALCIESAKNAVEEVVVVCEVEEDPSVAIARQCGATVYLQPFHGFTKQKNFALSKITQPWALSLDADEELSPELSKEIILTLQTPDANGYELARLNYFLGRKMKHSGIKKEYILRLVRTKNAHYEGGLVHERLVVSGPVKRLKETFAHHSYNTVGSYFEKFNRYTTLAAQTMYKKGCRFHLSFVLPTIPSEFLKRYVLKLGFLDGMRGLVWASFSAFYVLVKYIKLWYIQKQAEL